jgi:hypothetical protein
MLEYGMEQVNVNEASENKCEGEPAKVLADVSSLTCQL